MPTSIWTGRFSGTPLWMMFHSCANRSAGYSTASSRIRSLVEFSADSPFHAPQELAGNTAPYEKLAPADRAWFSLRANPNCPDGRLVLREHRQGVARQQAAVVLCVLVQNRRAKSLIIAAAVKRPREHNLTQRP